MVTLPRLAPIDTFTLVSRRSDSSSSSSSRPGARRRRADAGAAGEDEVGAGGVVGPALALLGDPAPRPTLQDVVVEPATVMVEVSVVKETFGTVTVVTSWVVIELLEHVRRRILKSPRHYIH